MFGSFFAFRLFGISTYIQWLTVLMIFFFFSISEIQGFLMLIGFISIIPHEYAHAVVAKKMGNPVGDILITPLGGLANIYFRPFDHRTEFLVAAAGPAVNLVLFLASVGASFLFSGTVQQILLYVAFVNLILVVFNLLPLLPMDGGRIMRATLGYLISEPKATQFSCGVSFGLCVVMFMAGICLFNPLLSIMSVCIHFMSKEELRKVNLALKDGSIDECN